MYDVMHKKEKYLLADTYGKYMVELLNGEA